MLDVIYHNLPKVRGMYQDTFDISFPEFSNIYKAVLNRHDFVHRNGKTKDGHIHSITKENIKELSCEVKLFVKEIDIQLKKLK